MREPGEGVNRDRKARRKRIAWVAGSLLLTLLVLFGGLVAYVAAVNQVAPYTPPSVTLPVPNAFDDFLAASALAHDSAAISPKYGTIPGTVSLRGGIQANRAALARVRVGLRHRFLTPPNYDYDRPRSELGCFRLDARLLIAEGRLAEQEGRWRDAARSYLDCLRLAKDVQCGGPFTQYLVGNSIWKMGADPIQHLVGRLDAVTALASAREITTLQNDGPEMADVLVRERDWTLAEWSGKLRQFRSPRDYAAHLEAATDAYDWPEAWRMYLTPKRPILQQYRDYLDASTLSARQPYYARPALAPPPGELLVHLMLGGGYGVPICADQQKALARIITVQLAARAYTLEHGAPPPNAQALVPGYLDKVPDDPFAPRPITLRIKDGMALVYSVGPDGVDDGGTSLKGVIVPGSKGDYLTVKAQK